MDHDEDDFDSDIYEDLRVFAWGVVLVTLVLCITLGLLAATGSLA